MRISDWSSDVCSSDLGGLAADLVLGLGLVREDVALVEPHLHADAAGGRTGLAEAVVDVGPQRVQRYPTFAVPLGAGHLGAAEAAGALDPDAEGARLQLGRASCRERVCQYV